MYLPFLLVDHQSGKKLGTEQNDWVVFISKRFSTKDPYEIGWVNSFQKRRFSQLRDGHYLDNTILIMAVI